MRKLSGTIVELHLTEKYIWIFSPLPRFPSCTYQQLKTTVIAIKRLPSARSSLAERPERFQVQRALLLASCASISWCGRKALLESFHVYIFKLSTKCQWNCWHIDATFHSMRSVSWNKSFSWQTRRETPAIVTQLKCFSLFPLYSPFTKAL